MCQTFLTSVYTPSVVLATIARSVCAMHPECGEDDCGGRARGCNAKRFILAGAPSGTSVDLLLLRYQCDWGPAACSHGRIVCNLQCSLKARIWKATRCIWVNTPWRRRH